MKTFAIMIIWFGAGKYAQFDVEKFDTVVECEAAKDVMLKHTESRWTIGGPGADDVSCREVRP